jgi:hypothetical protein
MPLDTYNNLQNAVLDWLARPGDALVSPAVPDMITMFEEEARDRLRTRFVEKTVTIPPPGPGTSILPLPLDYSEMREMWVDTNYGRRVFTFQTPVNMDCNIYGLPGQSVAYTIEGLNLRVVGTAGDTDPDTGIADPINLTYLSGLTGLSASTPTNWLLQNYPTAYLMGTLTMAAPYIGDDPRLQIWLGAREAAFERIRLADRRAKFPHGLMIQTDVKNP